MKTLKKIIALFLILTFFNVCQGQNTSNTEESAVLVSHLAKIAVEQQIKSGQEISGAEKLSDLKNLYQRIIEEESSVIETSRGLCFIPCKLCPCPDFPNEIPPFISYAKSKLKLSKVVDAQNKPLGSIKNSKTTIEEKTYLVQQFSFYDKKYKGKYSMIIVDGTLGKKFKVDFEKSK